MSTRKGPAEAGDNSDPVFRAEQIREAFSGLLAIADDKAAALERFKSRADKEVSKLKALGLKRKHWQAAYDYASDKSRAENADKTEDREKIERDMKIGKAVYVECVAAVDESGQLDFDEILNEGQEARDAEKKAPEAKVGKVKGGGAKATGPKLVQ